MPSSPPGPGNNYLVTRETLLDEATLNAILSSIGSRLTAREALEATFQTLIDAGVAQAVEIAQNELGPIVEDAQSARDTLLAWGGGWACRFIQWTERRRHFHDGRPDGRAQRLAHVSPRHSRPVVGQ